MLHICGDDMAILDDVAATGAEMYEVDSALRICRGRTGRGAPLPVRCSHRGGAVRRRGNDLGIPLTARASEPCCGSSQLIWIVRENGADLPLIRYITLQGVRPGGSVSNWFASSSFWNRSASGSHFKGRPTWQAM